MLPRLLPKTILPQPAARGVRLCLLHAAQVPPCIQSTGPRSVRVALEVQTGQSKRALLSVSDNEVLAAVCAPPREGLANAELLEFLQKVLTVTRAQLQLSRGWSASSKYLVVSGVQAVDVFKKLKAAVENDVLPTGPTGVATQNGPNTEAGPAFTAGAASNAARRNWEVSDTPPCRCHGRARMQLSRTRTPSRRVPARRREPACWPLTRRWWHRRARSSRTSPTPPQGSSSPSSNEDRPRSGGAAAATPCQMVVHVRLAFSGTVRRPHMPEGRRSSPTPPQGARSLRCIPS